jgi:cytochrome c553
MMSATARGLTDADVQSLAGFYAGLKIKTAASPASGQDLAAGKARAAVCTACHGANGVSTNPVWPSLAGQQKDYIVAALKAYKEGARKNEMMSGIAKDLSDADMEALAAYYSSASVN